MTPLRKSAGFLMRDSWRPGAVLAHKLELSGDRNAPAAARAWVSGLVACRIGAEDLLDMTVLVSEIVTNAVRHGGTGAHDKVVVHLALATDVLRVEVCDQGPGFTPPAVPKARPQGGGNGLVMLATMSSSWGVSVDDGTCVWFERALASAAA